MNCEWMLYVFMIFCFSVAVYAYFQVGLLLVKESKEKGNENHYY